MEKKSKGRAETLLFVFVIAFVVFILLFIIIATIIAIVKNFKKGGTLLSPPQTTREKESDATNPLPSEELPVESMTLRSEGKTADRGALGETKHVHAPGNLH